MNYFQCPLVLGATGGLGTNILVKLCQWSGCFMIGKKDRFNDAIDFEPFYNNWLDKILSNTDFPLSESQNQQMHRDFLQCVQNHREKIPDEQMRWGWKNSRSLYFLSYFHSIFPEMKFIHLIRDGRDIAFSPIQKKLLAQTRVFFDKKWDNFPIPYTLMNVWQNTNCSIATYCENKMKDNFLRIRFEDLCENPYGMIKVIMNFLQISQVNISMLAKSITKSSTIGKWHMYPIDLVKDIEEIGNIGLKKFGYL